MTNPNESSPDWWRIEAKSSEPDEAGHALIEIGAAGVEVLGEKSLACFFRGSASELRAFLELISTLPISEVSHSRIENKDWLKGCLDAWEKCEIGEVRIVPCLDDAVTERRELDILLKPGMGFGTGLHPTTNTAISFLQLNSLIEKTPKRVLDIGTGSGILAIAAAKIFKAEVHATEIDPDAALNAEENIALNLLGDRVSILDPSLDRLEGKYDLIIANIYAEVLIGLEPRIRALLADDGAVILSGVMAEKKPIIESGFDASRWLITHHKSVNGWDSFFLRRRQ